MIRAAIFDLDELILISRKFIKPQNVKSAVIMVILLIAFLRESPRSKG
ncbi:hypothetical protein DSBG_4181 [Desulfosporosinus sp. BG]|nr:hypothetical protein DSBG_4181 [Desulfosporosinus sp. BG]